MESGRPIQFAATGDSFITRRLPSEKTKPFEQLSALIHQADVRFTNLELTIHRNEGIPSALSGGSWAMAPPEMLEDLRAYGFNLIAWATNHTMDYLYAGLEATERYLNAYGFVHAGAGCNLASASEPRYLETAAGRVALIAAASTFHDFQRAGDQRPDMIGRPGVNPLRFITTHLLSKERLDVLKEIADIVKINARKNMSIKNGYAKPAEPGVFEFGMHRFRESPQEGVATTPHPKDMARIRRSISEAKRQADYVLVSLHAHEMRGDQWEEPADFIEIFARACIDEGAHAVIGHGPHILRGIEIYKRRPIFYSLGNFIFQNETIARSPADAYEKHGLGHEHTAQDVMDAKSQYGTRGYVTIPEIYQTVLPIWSMKDGQLQHLDLYPVELGFGKHRSQAGTPVLSQDESILQNLQRLSKPYGTKIDIENGIGKVRLA